MKQDKAYIIMIVTLFAILAGIIYYIISMDKRVETVIQKEEKTEETPYSLSHYKPLPRSSPLPKEKEFVENEFYTEDFEPTGVFSTVWAFDRENFFIGGMNGDILKFDGKKTVKFKTDFKGWIFAIAGRSPKEVFAACQDGIVLKFDGNKWEKFKEFESKIRLLTIWASKDNNIADIFVGGDYGSIFHFNGKKWAKMNTGILSRVWCLWGTAPDNMYAAIDEKDRILHFDGKKWSPVIIPFPKKYTYYSIFGFSENNIYVGGDKGTLLHFNGQNWKLMEDTGLREADFIKSISGSSSDNLFLCSYFGRIIHWDGKKAHIEVVQPQQKCFYGVWAVDKDCVFAVGDDGTINQYNGREWKRLAFGNPKKAVKKEAPRNDIVSLDNGKCPVVQYSTGKWIPQRDIKPIDLVGIWGTSKDNVFAVGNAGVIYHFDGKKWTQHESHTNKTFYCVKGITPNSVFVCGVEGTILRHKSGKWETMKSGTMKNLTALWFASPNRGFAAGFEGTILQYDGREWKQSVEPGKLKHINFSDIWGFSEDNVYAVGDLGTIYHYNGINWKKIPTPTTKWLLSAWGADKNNLFVGSEDGLILHVDGEKVTEMDAGVTTCIFGLWGSSRNNVYGIAGDGGAIVRYDGNNWRQIAAADGYLCDIWGVDENLFYVVGEGKK